VNERERDRLSEESFLSIHRLEQEYFSKAENLYLSDEDYISPYYGGLSDGSENW
jgi:hypothetical protein